MLKGSPSLLAADLKGVFDPSRFSMTRAPVHMGMLVPYNGPRIPSCLDMLIKMPVTDVHLPEIYRENETIVEFVDCAVKNNAMFKPRWREECYLYLTVDHRTVMPGKTHRNSGWHFDGMQGSRYPEKLPVCHQYVASNCLGTEYYIGSDIDLTGLDEKNHNWFDEIENQMPAQPQTIRAEPGEIAAVSAYQIHRSVPAEETTERLFLRLDVSHKKQDRLGNTVNPELRAPWPMVERRFELHRPVMDTGWNNPTY